MSAVHCKGHLDFNPRYALVLLAAVVITFVAACAATPNAESTGGYVDDATITAKVKADLAEDPKVSAPSVHVETYKGVVDLSGFVNSQEQLEEARAVASRVSGVKAVHDNLIVKGAVAPPTATEQRAQ